MKTKQASKRIPYDNWSSKSAKEYIHDFFSIRVGVTQELTAF